MALILFADGLKIGAVSNWSVTERFPEKKTVLGKEIVTQKPKDQCQFTSPKPLKRKSQLWLISENSEKLILSDLSVQSGTRVTATIQDRQKI